MHEHLKRKARRQKRFLELLQVSMAILLLLAGACSCAYRPSAPEPQVQLVVYLFSASESSGKAVFINGQERRVDTLEPSIHEFLLIPFSDLQRLQEKNQRCEVWR